MKILCIDDEAESHKILKMAFQQWSPHPASLVEAYDLKGAMDAISKSEFAMAFVDLHYLGKKEGPAILTSLREASAEMPLVVLSSARDFPSVQECMRCGATDYVVKGFGKAEFVAVVERALERRHFKRLETRALREAEKKVSALQLVGNSPAMRKLRDLLQKLAPKDVPVLLEGETGTGKEMAARALHFWGKNPSAPYVVVNCASIPESLAESFFFGHQKGAFTGADRNQAGIFSEADGGTLFLDEINSLPLSLQAKLLRVLQDGEVRRLGDSQTREVKFRIICASNHSLEKMVQENRFREDLFFRINVMRVSLPPLRERKEDLLPLADHFMPEREISAELWKMLENHNWPGNVRELRNLLLGMDAVAETGETLGVEHLPENFLRRFSGEMAEDAESVEDVTAFVDAQALREREYLSKVFRAAGGNVSKMARMLGLDRSNLHQKLVRLGIHRVKSL